MSLKEKFQAFEEAMQQSGGGAIKEAFDALIALLGTTDTALKDEFTVSPSFVDDTATEKSAHGYFFIKDLYNYLRKTPDGKSKAALLYGHVLRISHMETYTDLPNYFHRRIRPHDTYDNQLFSLKQEENGEAALYRHKEAMGTKKTYRTVVPKNWSGFADAHTFGLVIWTAVGLLMMPMNKNGFLIAGKQRKQPRLAVSELGNTVKKHRVVARFADKCMLSSLP
jgi:hypothetical protein